MQSKQEMPQPTSAPKTTTTPPAATSVPPIPLSNSSNALTDLDEDPNLSNLSTSIDSLDSFSSAGSAAQPFQSAIPHMGNPNPMGLLDNSKMAAELLRLREELAAAKASEKQAKQDLAAVLAIQRKREDQLKKAMEEIEALKKINHTLQEKVTSEFIEVVGTDEAAAGFLYQYNKSHRKQVQKSPKPAATAAAAATTGTGAGAGSSVLTTVLSYMPALPTFGFGSSNK